MAVVTVDIASLFQFPGPNIIGAGNANTTSPGTYPDGVRSVESKCPSHDIYAWKRTTTRPNHLIQNMNCPKCDSTDIRKWSLRNLLVALADVVIHFVLACAWFDVGDITGFEGLRLKRRCRHCGHRYFVPTRPKRNYNRCLKCDYDLTGNISGRCPECGRETVQS